MIRLFSSSYAFLGRNLNRGSDQTRGITFLLLAVFAFSLMDATAKYLAEFYAPAQVVWARYLGNFAVLALYYRQNFLPSLRSRQPLAQFARALCQLGSVSLFFTALQHIGIAEATAIMDMNPVLITLGAALFLGEPIGWRRIAGIVAAMIGAMIIIRPGMGVFDAAAILPLIGAFTYAAGALLTRVVRTDSLATSLVWTVLIGFFASSIVVPWFWQPIAWQHLWAFAIIGLLGAASQALLIYAYSIAEAGAIAPFGYTGLVWAAAWGWLFWGVLPDQWTVLGAGIIVAAGLYIWYRETRLARKEKAAHG